MKSLNKLVLVIITFGLTLTSVSLKAQQQYGFSTKTSCLKLYAYPNKVDSACETVQWTVGNTVVSKSDVLSYTFSSSGTYTVCMKITNSCKRWDTTICDKITVKACPCDTTKVTMKVLEDSISCGKYYFYTTPYTNNTTKYSHEWSFGDGDSAYTNDPVKSYSKDNNYQVCVKTSWYEQNTLCTKSVCETVKVSCNSTKSCDWSKVKLSYTNNCKTYKFEIAGTADSCFQTQTLIVSKNNTRDIDSFEKRNFSKTFKDTGLYYVYVKVYNYCGNCDTTLYTALNITCTNDSTSKNCNWSNVGIGHGISKDSCGLVAFEANAIKDTCVHIDFLWGNTVTKDKRFLTKKVEKNGTYYYGFRYRNECNNCDTVIWKSFVIDCFDPPKCEWPTNMGYKVTLPECPWLSIKMNEFDDSCYKISVTVNGITATQSRVNYRIYEYKMPENGTYKICVKFVNQCTGCDTTICTSYTTDCISNKTCDWSKLELSWSNRKACNTYVFEGTYYADSCITQKLKIVSGNTIIYQETGRVHDYTFKKSGYYNVCLWGYNSCLQCDTWICKTLFVDCDSTGNACNWSGNNFYIGQKDSNCYRIFEAPTEKSSCIKYEWYSLADSSLILIGSGRVLKHQFKQKGLYTFYLKMTDTCNRCDTVLTQKFEVNCNRSGIEKMEQKWLIYPNPAKEFIYINNQQIVNARILGIDGKVYYNGKISKNGIISTKHLISGVYIIELSNHGMIEQHSIILE